MVDITTTVIGSAPAKAVYALIGEQTNTVIKGMAKQMTLGTDFGRANC